MRRGTGNQLSPAAKEFHKAIMDFFQNHGFCFKHTWPSITPAMTYWMNNNFQYLQSIPSL